MQELLDIHVILAVNQYPDIFIEIRIKMVEILFCQYYVSGLSNNILLQALNIWHLNQSFTLNFLKQPVLFSIYFKIYLLDYYTLLQITIFFIQNKEITMINRNE